MALQFVEFSPTTKLGAAAKQDGAAESVTAGVIVKVIYQDTANRRQLAAALEKAKQEVLSHEA
jgi:hypothetical protein